MKKNPDCGIMVIIDKNSVLLFIYSSNTSYKEGIANRLQSTSFILGAV